jgi:hypothetical protein
MYLTRNRKLEIKNNELEENNKLINNKQIPDLQIPDIIQCLICWEPENNKNPIIKMKNIILFESSCECDCKFHCNCLFEWVSKTPTCPICRNPLTINIEILEIHQFGPHYKLKKFVKKLGNVSYKALLIIVKYISALCLLHVSIRIIAVILEM